MDIKNLIKRVILTRKDKDLSCSLENEKQKTIKAELAVWYAEQKIKQLEEKITALEAKSFVYEQIIAKSNFAPFVQTTRAESDKE